MTSDGDPYLIYLAAKAGQAEQLEALLQERLPHERYLESLHRTQRDLHDGPAFTATDYLEYVDKQTGFTPLLAAVFHHRERCARLLLEHGADVHNHGAKTDQTPLRMAVTDLNLDVRMVELLVSYGGSPFLEAKDGMNPMDEIVQLRQHRVGPMPYALGSVLLCLRRRCPFRGHLEIKVDRYLGLSQTWRKFFCVLSPREKVAGFPADMQLLIFSKNGFDPVTSVWVTNAAPVEIPLKAHGRVSYELVLSSRQQRRPSKLFAPSNQRAGFSIFVRALSKEAVEARWLRKFVDLATSEPSMAMITGDSETPVPFRHSMDIAAATVAADKDAKPQAVLQSSKSKLLSASFSFSSDSAHMTLPLNQDAEARTESHCRSPAAAVSTQRIPTISPIALPYGTPSQAPSPPTRKHSYTALPQQSPSTPQRAHSSASHRASPSGSFSSSVTPPQQPSSVAQSEVGSSASPARSSRTEVWRSNPAFSPRSRLENMVSGYRSSQSLPSCKGFIAVDRRLTDSWRAMLLEELEDESDTEQGADLRTTLPVVSEHTSLPALMEQWGMHSSHPTPQPALLHQQAPMHAQHTPELPAAHSPSPAQTTQSLVRSSTPLSSHAQRLETAFAQLPPAITSSHTLITHNTAPAGALLQSHVYQAQGTNGHHTWQAEQDTTSQAAKPWPQLQEAAQSRMAHTYHTAEDARPAPSNHGVPAAAPASLLIESNVELVKARSAMLDIPSAELLDSILDFANAVCGEAQLEAAGNHVEEFQAAAPAWNNGASKAQSEPAKRRPANLNSMSRMSVASSIEPFSDDDDVTILDTTEVTKLSPQGLQPLPEGQHHAALPKSRNTDHHHRQKHHEDDLVFEVPQAPNDVPFHHYSLSAQVRGDSSPNAAAQYGHMNRMYDTSTSDVSSHAAALNQLQAPHHYQNGSTRLSAHSHSDYSSQHPSSIYDSSGSQSILESEHQLYHNVIDQTAALPQLEPSQFREMIDDIMAHSEQQAAQVHQSGGAATSAAALHPIWEDEEACLEGHDSPCPATIGIRAA